MLDASASALVGVYQRYVSPYKGFCCAYRAQTNRRSCSAYAKVIIERLGVEALSVAMPRQFARCRAAYLALAESAHARDKPAESARKKRWWDRCDCSPCDCATIGRCDLPCDCSF